MRQVEESGDRKRELIKLGIPRSTYYEWRKTGGDSKSKAPKSVWNKTPKGIEEKILEYRFSCDKQKNSPARILENLEVNQGYIMAESGVKSVLKRNNCSSLIRTKKKYYHIRPKAEKFLDVVCFDDDEFTRTKPHDTFVLNFIDEASYMALENRVFFHRTNQYDIVKGLKAIKRKYGKYPKVIRCDNARVHKAISVKTFCVKNNIEIDYITKGCPEENWPVESFHRNLNQDLIYQHGFKTQREWQEAIDEYVEFHNMKKRHRSDPILRTPHEIAFAYTTKLTQARLKTKLQRKLHGQTRVEKYVDKKILEESQKYYQLKPYSVSEMCVS